MTHISGQYTVRNGAVHCHRCGWSRIVASTEAEAWRSHQSSANHQRAVERDGRGDDLRALFASLLPAV